MFKDTIKKIITFQSKGLLGFVSFIESIFFPIPTDVLLIPMCFARPDEWKILALITTITSVLGGVFGFYLGSLLFPEIYPYIISMGYEDKFNSAKSLFITHGAIILLISSFTPLPYKIFTLVAGFLSIDIFLFIIISLIGRGLRFYLVAFITKEYGVTLLNYINRYFLYIAFIIIAVYILSNLNN